MTAYSVTLNGVTATPFEPAILTAISGLGQTARTGRVALATGGRVANGPDVPDGGDIVCEVALSDADPTVVEALTVQWIDAWAPSATDVELTVELAAGARIRRGRPTSIDVDDSNLPNGLVVLRCVFDAMDPLTYIDPANTATVYVPVYTGGFGEPFGEPFGEGASLVGGPGDATIFGTGTAPATWTAVLHGPLLNPLIRLDDEAMQINGNIAAGSILEVDSARRTMKLDGTIRPWATFDSDWFTMPTAGTAKTLRLSADNTGGWATFSWRTANY